jgi:hypothetical protein
MQLLADRVEERVATSDRERVAIEIVVRPSALGGDEQPVADRQ